MARGLQRFELLDPRIVHELATAPSDRLRRIAVAAAEVAVDRTAGSSPLLAKAVAELRRGVLDIESRDAVTRLANELDDRYLELHVAEEDSGDVSPRQEVAFARARAAAAVAYAYDPDPALAAGETVYEAVAATGDAAGMLDIVTATQ
jgi:hypothetical protein